MPQKNRKAVLPEKQNADAKHHIELLENLNQFLIAEGTAASAPLPVQPLTPELQRAIQVLCETYENLNLRIETTLASAESDFISALSEINGHEAELRHLVGLFVSELRHTSSATENQSVLLRLSFDDENDLTHQVETIVKVSGAKT